MTKWTHFRIDGTRGVIVFHKKDIVDIFPISQIVRNFLDHSDDHEIEVIPKKEMKEIIKVQDLVFEKMNAGKS